MGLMGFAHRSSNIKHLKARCEERGSDLAAVGSIMQGMPFLTLAEAYANVSPLLFSLSCLDDLRRLMHPLLAGTRARSRTRGADSRTHDGRRDQGGSQGTFSLPLSLWPCFPLLSLESLTNSTQPRSLASQT